MRLFRVYAISHPNGRIRAVLICLVLVGGMGLWWWTTSPSRVEREVRRFSRDCVTELNAVPARASAARLAHCLTTDVVIEFGRGSPPIQGQNTLLSMVERLQRRIAAFLIRIDDMSVEIVDSTRVHVTFTVSIVGRSGEFGERSFDAREFAAEIRQTTDGWRMSRLTAVEIFR